MADVSFTRTPLTSSEAEAGNQNQDHPEAESAAEAAERSTQVISNLNTGERLSVKSDSAGQKKYRL